LKLYLLIHIILNKIFELYLGHCKKKRYFKMEGE
jgi:hypothetical protein